MSSRTFYSSVCLVIILCSTVLQAQWKWEKVPLPPPFNTGRYLDVCFLSSNPNYGWISGHDGLVLRTTDGGLTWRGSTTPIVAQLEDIVFVSESIGYCSGIAKQTNPENTGGIFKTIDGGATWKDITPIVNNNGALLRLPVFGCHFSDAANGIAVGGGCGEPQFFYHTTDGGRTWMITWAQEPMSGISHAIPTTDGNWYASSSGFLWKSIDGIQWNKYSSTGEKYWQEGFAQCGNSFLTATSGVECHGGATERGDMRFSVDAGRTWNTVVVPNQMFGAFLSNDKEGWACGRNGSLFYTPDAGSTWQSQSIGIPANTNLDNVYFLDTQHGFVVGDGIYRTGYSHFALHNNETFMQSVNLQILPQPVSKASTISFTLPTATYCTVVVNDVLGRPINTIFDGEMLSGTHTLQLDATGLAEGTYFVTIHVADNIANQKISVIR